MGTPAATRIEKDNDYISLHTRWDGDLDCMKEQVLEITNEWENSINLFKEVLEKGDFGTSNLKEWIINLEKTLEDYKKNPTIETATLFYSARSFTHHLPNPNKAESNLLNHWGAESPDLIINYDSEDIKFTKPKTKQKFNCKEKELSKEYEVFRIKSSDGESYIDMKFKEISKEEIVKEILLLPLFWRDLYTISKIIESPILDSKDKNIYYNHKNKPIFKLFDKLKYFYSPIKKYSNLVQSRNANNNIFNDKEKKEANEYIIEDLLSLIPFDMYVNALSVHIMLRFSGKIFPLTFGESKLNKEPMFNVYLTDRSLSSIYFDLKIEDQIITKTIDEFKIREKKFCDYYDLKDIPSYQMKYFNNGNGIGIGYEENIVEIMKTQRDIEIKELENKKAL